MLEKCLESREACGTTVHLPNVPGVRWRPRLAHGWANVFLVGACLSPHQAEDPGCPGSLEHPWARGAASHVQTESPSQRSPVFAESLVWGGSQENSRLYFSLAVANLAGKAWDTSSPPPHSSFLLSLFSVGWLLTFQQLLTHILTAR